MTRGYGMKYRRWVLPSKAIEPFLTARLKLCRMVAGFMSGSLAAISSGASGRDASLRTLMIRLSSITDLELTIFDKTREHFNHIIEGSFRLGEALNRISFDTMPNTSPSGHNRHGLPGRDHPELVTDKADSVYVSISCLDFHGLRMEGESSRCVGFKHFLTSLCVVTPCDSCVVS